MSDAKLNGQPDILKVAKIGKNKVQFEDGEPFEVDVIVTINNWSEVDRQFRNEKGEVQPEHRVSLNQAAWEFVQAIVKVSVPKHRDISMAEALAFLAVISKEARRLKSFFDASSEDEPSSRASSPTVRFSV